VPLWEGSNTGDRGSAYRFHIPDPVVFKKSLRVEIEHKGSQSFPDGKSDGFIERDDLMSSVAFWYQMEPHKAWPALPCGKDRLPFHDTILVKGWEIEKTAKHSNHPFMVQSVSGVMDGKQLFLQANDRKGWMEKSFTLDKPQIMDLECRFVHSYDYGIYRVLLDGKEIAKYDLYSPTATPTPHRLGICKLKAGQHTLRFECVGKSSDSKGYFLGFDALTARVLIYARDPSVDLRTLQRK
jgi:hypothetical protein